MEFCSCALLVFDIAGGGGHTPATSCHTGLTNSLEDHFNLRALLFVNTNDWPALSNLSGQSNKGYRACTHCLEETDSMYLKHCRKIVYMGHR